MPKAGQKVTIEDTTICSIGTNTKLRLMYLFKPILKVVLHRLLRPYQKCTLFLLMQGLLQLLIRLLASLTIEVLTTMIFQGHTCSPSAILTSVNGPFTMPTLLRLCHTNTSLEAKNCLIINSQTTRQYRNRFTRFAAHTV